MTSFKKPANSSGKLSPSAEKMLELQDKVLLEWSKRLRQNVKEAQQLPQPILANTFPTFYEKLVQAVASNHPATSSEEGGTIASEHGGERARLTGYNVQAIVAEYQILRWAIFDVLTSNGVNLDGRESFVINTSIDESIRESVNAFALAQSILRERFFTALTHDLRTPLSTAYMAAEFIKHSPDLNKIKEFAQKITDNLKRMNTMIQDLLDTAILESGEKPRLRLEEFHISEVINEVRSEFFDTHAANIEYEGSSVKGWWDRQAFKRALENLLGNALKYGAPDAPIKIGVKSYEGRLVLTVHNEGTPIPSEQMECIFQVYQRAIAAKEGNQEGWGIGLPYVRSVAENHGGSVVVDSTVETGTNFTINVPVDARPYRDAPTLG